MHRSTVFIRPADSSIVGSLIIWIRFLGIPSLSSASFISSTARTPTPFARGWGQIMTALPHFRAHMELCMGLMTGLVVAVTQPTTPMGLATFIIPLTSSRSMIPRLFWSFMRHQVLLDLFLHLAILLSTRPIRVSSTAILASSSAWSYIALPIALAAASTCSWLIFSNSFWAARAASTSDCRYSCVSTIVTS